MSAYKAAIDETMKTIDKRAKCYRNLIAVVLITCFCSIGGTLVTWTLVPVAGLLLVLPICGFYFLFDGKLLSDWQSQLFISWIKRDLDFWGYRDAMRVAPHLPKVTLQSMIETLPSSSNWAMERAASGKTREAVVLVVNAINGNRAYASLFKAEAFSIVIVSIIWAVTSADWYPMIFVAAILPLLILIILRKRWLLRKLGLLISVVRRDQEFNEEIFSGLIDQLDWSDIPSSDKKKMIAVVRAC
ncbi:MAG: hypothetical protein Q7T35_01885 [Nitrosomonas sp.]|nr:hypothetical protein [Nitrosomonas sp.]